MARLWVQVGQYVICQALEGHERCGWKNGDPQCVDDSNRCIGIEGHASYDVMVFGTHAVEQDFHINEKYEVWRA